MRCFTFLAPVALMAISTVAAANDAECHPAFSSGDVSVVVEGIDIEAGSRTVRDFQVRVVDRGSEGAAPLATSSNSLCPAKIRIARTGLSTNPDSPPFSLAAPSNPNLEILPDAAAGETSNSDVLIANVPPGRQGRSVPFQLSLSTDWGIRAGDYHEQLRMLLVDASGSIVDTAILSITFAVPRAASIRFVGAVVGETAGPAQIDLGTLSTTRPTYSAPFGALILSTAPYVVNFESENQGSLANEATGEQIPYIMTFDASQVDLAGSNAFAFDGPTPRSGDRRPMTIQVPPASAPSGRYADRITATVTAM